MSHDCVQQGFLGQVKEFMDNTKGVRIQLGAVVIAIVFQVVTFAFLWGGLTNTVSTHEKNISFLMNKFNNIRLIGYVNAEEVNERTP